MVKEEHNLSDEQVKLVDYLVARVTEVVERKVEARTQKNWQLIRLLLVVIAVILAPSAWLSIKTIVRQEVNNERKSLLEKVDSVQLDVGNNANSLKKMMNEQLQYVNFTNQAAVMNLQSSVGPDEIKELMEEIQQIAKIPGIMHNKTLPFVLNNVVEVLVKFGYEDYLEELDQLFPVIDKSEAINKKFIAYYGRKILSIMDSNDAHQAKYYKIFQNRVRVAELNSAEEDSLPFQILVQFHLSHNLRSTNVDTLLNSLNDLPIQSRAIALWTLMRNINPRFWQKNPLPSDFRVSKVVEKFVTVYHNMLLAIASTNGVKSTILNLYENANTVEDQKLGRYVINYFYQIPVTAQ